MPGGADMMMKWIQRDGTRKSVDTDAIVRMEFVPNKKYGHPMLTVMTCDIVDTIAGRPDLPGDPTYIPDMDTAEVMISQPDADKDARTKSLTCMTTYSNARHLSDLPCNGPSMVRGTRRHIVWATRKQRRTYYA